MQSDAGSPGRVAPALHDCTHPGYGAVDRGCPEHAAGEGVGQEPRRLGIQVGAVAQQVADGEEVLARAVLAGEESCPPLGTRPAPIGVLRAMHLIDEHDEDIRALPLAGPGDGQDVGEGRQEAGERPVHGERPPAADPPPDTAVAHGGERGAFSRAQGRAPVILAGIDRR